MKISEIFWISQVMLKLRITALPQLFSASKKHCWKKPKRKKTNRSSFAISNSRNLFTANAFSRSQLESHCAQGNCEYSCVCFACGRRSGSRIGSRSVSSFLPRSIVAFNPNENQFFGTVPNRYWRPTHIGNETK